MTCTKATRRPLHPREEIEMPCELGLGFARGGEPLAEAIRLEDGARRDGDGWAMRAVATAA